MHHIRSSKAAFWESENRRIRPKPSMTLSNFRAGGIFRLCSNVNRTFSSANSGDLDQMQHYVASHLGLLFAYNVSQKRTLGSYGINRFHYIHFYLTNFVMSTKEEITLRIYSVGQSEIQSKKGVY